MPTEIIEFNAIEKLPEILASIGAKKSFLVTGKNSYRQSGAKKAIEHLLAPDSYFIFNQFSVNPKLEEAQAGLEQFKQSHCDTIIALGGGSVIDMAKIINAIQTMPEQAEALATGKVKIKQPLLPLIAIPTTAGTGSEATHFAVVYVKGQKFSLAHPNLVPVVSIIDPSFTIDSPPYLTACVGFDALCQAIESYWAVGSTAHSQKFSREAILLLLPNLIKAIADPEDSNARLSLCRGANLAGKAINITKTTAPHAISYPLTSYFNLPHGHAAALTLGKFFILNDTNNPDQVRDPRGLSHLQKTMQELAILLKADSVAACSLLWYDYMKKCGLESDPVKLNLNNQQALDKVITNVNLERLANHPIALSEEQIRLLFNNQAGE